jgi:hypothetical protein
MDWIIAQLHNVIEKLGVRTPTYLKDIQEGVMHTGDGFKTLNARVLAFEGACIFEPITGDDLNCTVNPKHRPGQPHHTVASGADRPDQLMVGNAGDWLV